VPWRFNDPGQCNRRIGGGKVKELAHIHPSHREGSLHARWILLDYGSVVVHVFIKEARDYYRLEELWGDADITILKEED
jgi:ribosome-associated protein